MTTRLSAGIVALLTFVGMLLAGYLAGNPFTTILLRALLGLGVGLLAGALAGHAAQTLVTDHFRAVVEAQADAELAAADKKSEDSGDVGSGENKAAGENSRSDLQDPREQTRSLRAARQLLGRP